MMNRKTQHVSILGQKFTHGSITNTLLNGRKDIDIIDSETRTIIMLNLNNIANLYESLIITVEREFNDN